MGGKPRRRPAWPVCYRILLHDEKYRQFEHFVSTREEYDKAYEMIAGCEGLHLVESGPWPVMMPLTTIEQLCAEYDLEDLT